LKESEMERRKGDVTLLAVRIFPKMTNFVTQHCAEENPTTAAAEET